MQITVKMAYLKTVTTKIASFENRIKGTIAEKWLAYWKTVCRDYKDVALDVKRDIVAKPSKNILIVATAGLAYYMAINNPSERHFRNAFITHANNLLLVSPDLQNKKCVHHLRFLEQCYNSHTLRHLNLGILSLMWVDNYSGETNTYESTCEYMQYQYRSFHERIVDVGFLDSWWNMTRIMTDYDINY